MHVARKKSLAREKKICFNKNELIFDCSKTNTSWCPFLSNPKHSNENPRKGVEAGCWLIPISMSFTFFVVAYIIYLLNEN